MKHMTFKKLVSLILTFIMIVSSMSFTFVFAASPSDFIDFPTGWSKEAVTAAVANGLLTGKSANTLDPEGNLTRAEMATIINRAFGATIEKDISVYVDVPSSEWFYHEIAKAVNMQTFQGDGNNTMRPNAPITREEVFAVVARSLVLETSDYSPLNKFNDVSSISDWAKPYASILVAKSYVNGDNFGNINPQSNITREEFAQIMHNIFKTYYASAGDYSTTGANSSLIRTGGVTLSNVTIEGDLVLGDGVGKGDVTLNNVTIKGRLLARGGEGKVTLTNTTVGENVVVKDVNGTVNFNNYEDEAPFKNINKITPATFLQRTVTPTPGGSTGGGGGSSSDKDEIRYKIIHYIEAPDGTITLGDKKYKEKDSEIKYGKKNVKVKILAKQYSDYKLNVNLGDGDKVDELISVYNDDVFKLYYDKLLSTYKVTLDTNGGTVTPTYLDINKGSAIGTMPTPVRTDYTFDAWYKDKTFTDKITASTKVNADFTAYAKWVSEIKFMNEGTQHASVKVDIGASIGDSKMPSEPKKEGYIFTGWYIDEECTVKFTSQTAVNKNSVVYAGWSSEPVKTWTVTFNSNGGSAVAPITNVVNGTKITAPSDPEKPGMVFKGWYKGEDLNNKFDFDTAITADITLYAKWEVKLAEKYTVTFISKNSTYHKLENIEYGSKITAPTAPEITGEVFGGWYKDKDCTLPFTFKQDTVTSDMTLYAKWTPVETEKFTVIFYDGPVVDPDCRIDEVANVEKGTALTAERLLEAEGKTYIANAEGYKDGSYTHEITPELWYEAENGEWKIFDDTVQINSDMNVFYTFKNTSFFFDNIGFGEFKLPASVSFSVPYETDTRLMDSLKDALTLARSQISAGLSMPDGDIYAKAIEKASETAASKGYDIISPDGNLKYLCLDVSISEIIKPEEIDGEVGKFIERIFVEAETSEAKINLIGDLIADDSDIDTTTGGMHIYDYVLTLPEAERITFAADVHKYIAENGDYKDFIDKFGSGDEFIVTHKNLPFVLAVADVVYDYSYEELEAKIKDKFGAVINVLGEDVVRDFMRDAQDRYYEGAYNNADTSDIETLHGLMNANGADASFTTVYPAYLTFKINVIDDVFVPVYGKYYEKIRNKLETKNFYYFASNEYLQQLADAITPQQLIDDLLIKTSEDDEYIGYSLYGWTNSESGFMHYYDYALEKLILIDKALLWYEANLTPDDFESFKVDAFADAAKGLNKANEALDAYNKNGSLPLGKNIEDLKKIDAFNKIFTKLEDKLIKALEKYETTKFYGRTWDSDSLRYELEYFDETGDSLAGVILGTDDPRYNIDAVMDKDVTTKVLDKAGFTEYDTSDVDATMFSVTQQAVERTIKGNIIKIRRYFWDRGIYKQ